MAIIKSDKFILRPLKKEDAAEMARLAHDRVIYRNTLLLPHPYNIKHAKDWIRINLKNYKIKQPSNYVFAIEIDGKFSGAIGIHKIVYGHKAELGYWLGREYWGRGIMSEAAKKVSQFAFQKFKLKRLYATAFPWNKASMRIMEKAGMKFEGILRADAKKNGKFLDHHIYAKIKK